MMMRSVLALGFLVTCVGSLLASPQRSVSVPASVLEKDARLDVPVVAAPDVYTLGQAVDELGRFTRLPLVCASRQRPLRVFLAFKKGTAAELASCLAKSTGTSWAKVGEGYVLTDTPALAPLGLLSMDQGSVRLAQLREPLLHLTPGQRLKASTEQILRPQDLFPAQRQAWLQMAQVLYMRHTHLEKDALTLDGAYLRLVRAPRDDGASNEELQMYFPTRDGDNQSAVLVLSIPGLVLDRRVATGEGAADPRPVYRPARLSREPLPAPKGAREWRDDPVLATKVPVEGVSLERALESVAARIPDSMAVSSRFLERTCRLDARTASLSQILLAAEELTGGRWSRAGGAYVMQPHSEAEDLAGLNPFMRKKWSQWAAEDVVKRLNREQVEWISSGKRLAASHLSETQKRGLRWLALLAFSGSPEVPRSALDLEGIVLSRSSGKNPDRQDASIEFHIPTRGSEPLVAARCPFP